MTTYRRQGERLYFEVDDLSQAQVVMHRFVPQKLQRTMRYIEAVAADGRAIVLKDPYLGSGRILEKSTEGTRLPDAPEHSLREWREMLDAAKKEGRKRR